MFLDTMWKLLLTIFKFDYKMQVKLLEYFYDLYYCTKCSESKKKLSTIKAKN